VWGFEEEEEEHAEGERGKGEMVGKERSLKKLQRLEEVTGSEE